MSPKPTVNPSETRSSKPQKSSRKLLVALIIVAAILLATTVTFLTLFLLNLKNNGAKNSSQTNANSANNTANNANSATNNSNLQTANLGDNPNGSMAGGTSGPTLTVQYNSGVWQLNQKQDSADGWTSTETTLTGQTLTVNLTWPDIYGVGGTCGDQTDPIVSIKITPATNDSNFELLEMVTGSGTSYNLAASLFDSRDSAMANKYNSYKVGDNICGVGTSWTAVGGSTTFINSININGNQSNGGTLDQINSIMNSTEYQAARNILLSIREQ